MIYILLYVLIVLYAALFFFIVFNFWRIMIKQKKIVLIPLTIFYLSAFIIVIARIVDNIAFIKFYKHGQHMEGNDYKVGCKASMVATFACIIMGIYPVASII